jgi:hypothetical protein
MSVMRKLRKKANYNNQVEDIAKRIKVVDQLLETKSLRFSDNFKRVFFSRDIWDQQTKSWHLNACTSIFIWLTAKKPDLNINDFEVADLFDAKVFYKYAYATGKPSGEDVK